MGSISRGRRTERFIEEFGELALAEYGLPPGTYKTQGIGLDDVFQVARIYVELEFPSGTYPMMMDKIIFDPELMDEDLVEQIYEDYECRGLTREQAIERLKKAELIEQDYKEEEDGQEAQDTSQVVPH